MIHNFTQRKYIIKKLLVRTLLTFFCLGSTNVWAQRVIDLNSENTVSTSMLAINVIPHEFLKEAKASRPFAINSALQSAESVGVGDIVNLQLFAGKNYKATVSKTVTDVNNNFTLMLKLFDYPMGFAIITTNTEGKSLITVSIPEQGTSFGSRYAVNSKGCYLIEIDEKNIERRHCENDALPVPEGIPVQINNVVTNATVQQDVYCGPNAGENPNAPATINLLVVYTPAAATDVYTNQRGGINNIIATMIALGDYCFGISQTGITLQLAHSEQVSYTEDLNMNTSLSLLQNPSDGCMDNVHELRKQYNADLVQLITVDNSSGGLGYLMRNQSGSYNYGFSVVQVFSVGGDYPASVHEIGHNMGLGHGANMINPSHGVFPYSEGWDWMGNDNVRYCSVMGYWSGDNYSDGYRRYNTHYFANPNIYHQGVPTGDATRADAARSLRETKHVVAYYSDKAAILPGMPTNIVATNPTSNGATFSWDACANATEYYVCHPNADGGYSYAYNITNTTYTINYAGWFPSQCSTYEIFIIALNACGETRSATYMFSTKCVNEPVVTTLAATNVTATTATLGRTVNFNGAYVIEQGFKYKKISESVWQTSTTNDLSGLSPSTQYQFYAYATTVGITTFQGSTLTFTTAAAISPIITTATLPNGIIDTAYSQTLTASGTAPITWKQTAGNLPTGLNLSTDGIISGTPIIEGTFNFTVQATNSAGNDTKSFIISIQRIKIYHSEDKDGLRIFLRQPSAQTNTINAEQLGLQISDTIDWQTDETWISKIEGLTWNNETPKRLIQISCIGKHLAGTLNTSKWIALTNLSCPINQLTNLDVSNCTALTYLVCEDNQLTNLDVSKNTALISLNCNNNKLTNLDVSENTALIFLDCNSNQLTNLDVSKNTALSTLRCTINRLTNLDVSKNTVLTLLNCGTNQLTNLDVNKNTALTDLNCRYNQLTNLDVSQNTALDYLYCENNQLIYLDISKNTALTSLDCENNKLINLDISKNTALRMLFCKNNSIPLIDLYRIAQSNINPAWLELGQQNLPDAAVIINNPVAIDTVFYGVYTTFTVNPDLTSNYELDNGEITFLTPDTFTVTIKNPAILDGSVVQKFIATQLATDVTGVELNKSNTTINVSNTDQLIATVLPVDATNKNVKWESNNNTVATVTTNGLVRAIATGTAIITVTTEDGSYTASCTVTVVDLPINLTALTLNNGEKIALRRIVNLNYTFNGGIPTHFRAAESETALSSAAWKTYNPSALTYQFETETHELKTVYTQLKNSVGETSVKSASIFYKPLHQKLALTSFSMNNNAVKTNNRTVTLNHTVENGTPALYSVSENPVRVGEVWLPYVKTPLFELSENSGMKEVYFAIANSSDTSNTLSAKIYLDESVTVGGNGLEAKLFPNPVETVVNVVVENATQDVHVTVYNIMGKAVLMQTFTTSIFTVDLSRCQPGMLVVRIQCGDKYVIKKIIKL